MFPSINSFVRELQEIFGYPRRENFIVVIQRASNSCKIQNINIDDHFYEVAKMVEIGKVERMKS